MCILQGLFDNNRAAANQRVAAKQGLPWLVLCGPDGLSDPGTVQALRERLQV
jgi:hypothetical protein